MSPRTEPTSLILLLVFSLILTIAGCGQESEKQRDDAVRIVSLSPAISRTLEDLGLADRIVGRSTFCDFLDESIPIIGDLNTLHYERLIETQPTHILIQAPAREPANRELAALVEARGWTVLRWTSVNTIRDIREMVSSLPARLLEDDAPECRKAEKRAAELLARMDAALQTLPEDEEWTGSTLLVYHTEEPVGVFGSDTYLHEVLVALGGTNAVDLSGWVTLSLEDIVRLNPAAIITIERGESFDDSSTGAGVLAVLDIDAMRGGRIARLTHPDAWRPCTGIIEVAQELRTIMAEFAREQDDSP